MFHIIPIKALKDNYIWCIIDPVTNHCVIVDPGEAEPVKKVLADSNLSLTAIMITHHHADHTQGIFDLVEAYSVPVYGPATVHGVSFPLTENQSISLLNDLLIFEVIAVPGHTLDHIAYFGGNEILFCGDTLFSAGCGRLFEGSAEQMYASLLKLNKLPLETKIYCTHEYTLANLKFARIVEPTNSAITERMQQVEELINKGQPSLPSTLAIEQKTNPFLRSHEQSVIKSSSAYAQTHLKNPVEVFKYTRLWKDHFKS